MSGSLYTRSTLAGTDETTNLALLASKALSLRFDNNVLDSSPQGNDGTIHGSNYAYVDGVNGGKALRLSGNTYVHLGTSDSLQPADLTVSFWLKPNAPMTGEQMIMWNKSTWYSDGWYLTSESNTRPLAISLGSANTNGQPYKVSVNGSREAFFPVDAWTHVALTYDSETKEVNVYRNGLRQQTTIDYAIGQSGADGIVSADSTSQKSLGYNGPAYNGAYANYAIDEYEVYGIPADYEDIVRLYEQQSGESYDGEPAARADADALTLPTRASANLSLPIEGWARSSIRWSSSDATVIDASGTVRRPDVGEGDATVILTATVTNGLAELERSFTVLVPAVQAVDSLADVAMSQVVMTDGYYTNAFDKEVDYLLALEADKLLSAFRTTSGLQAKATVYGGWENTEIRGHTLGHYLTAISNAYTNATGSRKAQLKARIDYIIDELAAVQAANGNGYVSAFPTSFLDRVENSQGVWVPWYTLHKVLAGLVSAAQHGDNDKALTVAEGFGEYIYQRVSKWDAAMKARVLRVEYGGMNEALYDLYIMTDNIHFLKAAEQFDELTLFDRLYNNDDVLNGLHANTAIPKVVGALKRYVALGEAESEAYYLTVAENFWDMVVNHHSYVTGGNSENEHFGHPHVLDGERTNVNNETCNVYNMLKLSRELFKVTKDKKYADFYENAYTNAIMASQNPETGMSMYFQPMATGFFKVFGSAFSHFWCCTGTGMENFVKLNDSLYFTSRSSIYINMYLSSVLTLNDKNIVLTQQSELPHTGAGDASSGKVSFTVHTTGPADSALRFRIPDWSRTSPAVSINGQTLADYPVEDGYIVLQRQWTDGTVIVLDFPLTIELHDLPDNPYAVAFKYGPVVLSAGLGTNNMTTSGHGVNVLKPNPDPGVRDFITVLDGNLDRWKADAAQNLVQTEGKLAFTLKGTDMDDGGLVFTPHFSRYKDRYGIYFELFNDDSENYQKALLAAKEAGRAEASSISFVIVANDQYELAANRQTVNSTVGVYNGKSYRDARAGGWFSYDMEVKPGISNYLYMTYYSGDVGRQFDILIDDNKLVTEAIESRTPTGFYTKLREIPQQWIVNSRTKTVREADEQGQVVEREAHYITVRFSSTGGFVGGLFDIFRITTDYRSQAALKSLAFQTGSLSQPFDPEVTDYTLTVPAATESVQLSAAPVDEYGLVYVGDVLINDKLQRTIALTGDTTEVLVTTKAEDHTTARQYTIRIVRSDTLAEAQLRGADYARPGQLLELSYLLDNKTEILAQDVTVSFDAEQLEFVTAEPLDASTRIVAISDPALTPGKVRLLLVHLGDNHPSGELIGLHWRVKATAALKTTTASLSDISVANGAGEETVLSGASHAVQIYASGDLNGDGRYNVGDLAMIAYYYGKDDSDPNWSQYSKADLNGDGKIDIADLTAMAQLILAP